jgi:hypothetical protein
VADAPAPPPPQDAARPPDAAGPATCGPGMDCRSGCCYQGICVPGNTTVACGASGACVTCPPGEACFGTTCMVDPSRTYDLVAVRATVNPTDPSGSSWDVFGGLPDPYVVVRLNDGRTGMSSAQSDTLSPVWNEVIIPAVSVQLLMSGIFVQLWDQDTPPINPDDLIAQGMAPWSAAQIMAGQLTLAGGGTSLTLGLR